MINKQKIGIIGLGVMGANLALNIANKKYSISVYNRTSEKTNLFISNNVKNKNLFPFYTIETFIKSIKIPRKIILMIQSGIAIDKTISSILPYLDKGDILIDGGNSFYKDTIRRNNELSKKGFKFLGMGISGGEEGALNGPCIMPGGDKKTYDLVSKILKDISAKSKEDKQPCVEYIGPDGSGHYVKMVHNGIEYGDMQLIAESYFLLKKFLNLNNNEISNVFDDWNKGELNSYLIKITKNILNKKSESGKYLIDLVLDEASHKGTGKWTSKNALELGVPLSLITESVFARYISSLKKERKKAANFFKGPTIKQINDVNFIENIRQALYLGKIISYTQGFYQLQIISDKKKWNLNLRQIAKIFRAGCIIRAKFLNKISDAYKDNNISNLLMDSYFMSIANKYQKSLRYIVSCSILNGIPVPAFSSAICYYDSYRSDTLPANLIQAQRDYFGSHSYKRLDKKGIFHSSWKN